MKFLIDEDLPRSTCPLLKRYGHKAIDVRDIQMRGAKDAEIIAYAKNNKLCLITGDFDFANIRNYPPKEYYGLVVLKIPKDATGKYILNLIQEFLKQELVISELSGKLAIVGPVSIRIRIK